jgi:5,10-methylenetetrahydromethanopterin reductase
MGRYPELARAVERHPFHELTVHDVVWWRPVWPILTLVAASTERVAVGPDVTHPYLRHPVDTAACIAAIDELSGGRAILGLGAGSFLEPVGVAMERPLRAVRECAELVQRLLRRDRTPYEGALFRATEEAQFRWAPPRPSVPVFVGAFSEGMVAAASRWAAELRPPAVWATAFFRDLKRRAERAAREAGNDGFRVGCDVWLSLDRDRDASRAVGRRVLAQFLTVPHIAPLLELNEIDPAEVADVRAAFARGETDAAAARVSDRTLDAFVAAGDPADVRAGLRRLLDTAPSTVTFSGRLGPDPLAALELLGREVLPEFAGPA